MIPPSHLRNIPATIGHETSRLPFVPGVKLVHGADLPPPFGHGIRRRRKESVVLSPAEDHALGKLAPHADTDQAVDVALDRSRIYVDAHIRGFGHAPGVAHQPVGDVHEGAYPPCGAGGQGEGDGRIGALVDRDDGLRPVGGPSVRRGGTLALGGQDACAFGSDGAAPEEVQAGG